MTCLLIVVVWLWTKAASLVPIAFVIWSLDVVFEGESSSIPLLDRLLAE